MARDTHSGNPDLAGENFEFDDDQQMRRHLPRLSPSTRSAVTPEQDSLFPYLPADGELAIGSSTYSAGRIAASRPADADALLCTHHADLHACCLAGQRTIRHAM